MPERDSREADANSPDWEASAVLSEIFDLVQAGLVHLQETTNNFHEADDGFVEASIGDRADRIINIAVLGVEDINPAKMIRTEIGDRLHHLMRLEDLPIEDIQCAAEPLLHA